MKHIASIGFAVLVLACAANSAEDKPITATLRSTSFVTNDLEASARFFKDYLGYKELGRSKVTADKSRQIVGARGSETVSYISLVPAGWSKENPENAGISFVGIPSASGSAYENNGRRASRSGELILAHRVTNIDAIERRMRKDNVIFIAPLGLSGSGKSRSMAVLDPNGNRIEMYEY